MKNDQKLTFSKMFSNDHEMSNNRSRDVLETQKLYFEPLNTLVYISDDDICHLLQHKNMLKIAIF